VRGGGLMATASGGRLWLQDLLWEAAFLLVVFGLLYRSSTDDFTLCDGTSKFGTEKTDAELEEQVSGGHSWGDNCVPQSTLGDAGLSRDISSGCLGTAYSAYVSRCTAAMVATVACIGAASVNDLILWRSYDEIRYVKSFRTYVTTPTMMIASIMAVVCSYLWVKDCSQGWAGETDDGGAWVFVSLGGNLSATKMLLVLLVLGLRLGSIMINVLYATADGKPRYMTHRPVLTTVQVRGAYSELGESQPLLKSEEHIATLQEALRPWLVSFYQEYNPAKMDTVDQILDSYVGHEELLYKELHEKYDMGNTAMVVKDAEETTEKTGADMEM